MKTKSGNPKIAVAVLRVSTDDQALGAEAQRAAIEAWAKREGVAVAQYVEEIGVSGKLEVADRRGLLAAIVALETHGAGVLVVHRRDRLARSVMQACIADKMVEQAGAVVISTAGEGSGNTPEDALLRTIIDAFASFERAKIAARTTAALAVKRERGERVGGIPFGKRLDDDGKTLVCHLVETTAIGLARRKAAEGMKFTAISADLASRGFLARNHKPFSIRQISAMVAG